MVPNGFSIFIDLGHLRDPCRPPGYHPIRIFPRHLVTTACSGTYRFHLGRISPVRTFCHRYYKFRFDNGHNGFTRHRRNVRLSRPRFSWRSRFSSSHMGLFRFRMPNPLRMDMGAFKPPLWNPQKRDTPHYPKDSPPLGRIVMKRFIIKTLQVTPDELRKYLLYTIFHALETLPSVAQKNACR